MKAAIFFSAGETSGDIHGANLIRALRALDGEISFRGLGGEEMAAAGLERTHDLTAHAVMFLTGLLGKARSLWRIYRSTVASWDKDRPDLVLLIDYPGLNLRFASAAAARGIPVCYYVSPQVWAWARWRVRRIRRCVRRMLVILPFEKKFYEERGVSAAFVGNPVLDKIAALPGNPGFLREAGIPEGRPLVGLLPGSRTQEARRHLPMLLDAARRVREEAPEAFFALPVPAEENEYGRLCREAAGPFGAGLALLPGAVYDVMRHARLVLASSGTATLELACLQTPAVVFYRVPLYIYLLSRVFLKAPFIALPNLLLGRAVYPEFLLCRPRPDLVSAAAIPLLRDGPERRECLEGLRAVRESIGGPGASERAAREVMGLLAFP